MSGLFVENLTKEQILFTRKWIRRLRSGKYKQTKGALRRLSKEEYGFCCLGVACDASKLGRWDGEKYIVPSCRPIEGGLCYSPVQKLLGLTSGNGNYDSTDLTRLNDTGRKFSSIASVIEKELNLAIKTRTSTKTKCGVKKK